MKYSFLREDTLENNRHQLTFIGNELKIFLPKNYLEDESVFASTLGDKIETLGLFWFFTNGKYYELSLPIKIQFQFHSQETFKGKLKPELPVIDYDVFILKSGDAFCYDLAHLQDIEDMETMLLRIVDQGKLPATISYDHALEIVLKLLIASGLGTKLGISSAILEIVLSEIYRNKHNPAEPFRILLGRNKNATMYDYKTVRMARLSGLNSQFNSLIGEDSYNQITNIIVRQREGMPDRKSPFEKLLKY